VSRRGGHLLEVLDLYEQVVKGADDDEEITVRASQLRYLLTELRRLYRPGRGPLPRSGRTQVADKMTVRAAKRRKAELVAQGVSATDAEVQAANETSKMDNTASALSASAIVDRMRHPTRFSRVRKPRMKPKP
jgi:hypothetical protein